MLVFRFPICLQVRTAVAVAIGHAEEDTTKYDVDLVHLQDL